MLGFIQLCHNWMTLCHHVQTLETCVHRNRLSVYMINISAVKGILYIGVCMKFAHFSTFFIQPG